MFCLLLLGNSKHTGLRSQGQEHSQQTRSESKTYKENFNQGTARLLKNQDKQILISFDNCIAMYNVPV